VVVSGLAEGVDALAHTISIKSGIKNIAFLGHGLQVDISKKSSELRKRIIESGGAIVSEYFPRERYSREKFLRRNRLIASFSDVVIPVQADVPGGTYSTVLHALKSNKQVIGIEMENSSIVNFLREKGCVVVNTNKEADLIYLDRLVREALKKKGIQFDALRLFKNRINKLIDAYRKAMIAIGGVFLSEEDIGEKKGSPKWVEYVEDKFGIPHNKLIYIGYGVRKHDWTTAINSSVFYLHYSVCGIHNDIKKYVIPIKDMRSIIDFISLFFRDPPLFTYKATLNEGAELRILFDAGIKLEDADGHSFTLQSLFTYDKEYLLGRESRIDARSILFLLLIIQLWKEGIASRGAIWCVYPSSKKGKVSKNMEPYLRFFRGLTGSYYKQILERAEDTVDKSIARKRGEHHKVDFNQEKETLRLKARRVAGKKVIVVDDFSTTGMSLEASRLLLAEGGASEIVLCAVGKYGIGYRVYGPEDKIIYTLQLKEDRGAQDKLRSIIDEFNSRF